MFNLFKRKQIKKEEVKSKELVGFFSTDSLKLDTIKPTLIQYEQAIKKSFQRDVDEFIVKDPKFTMDAANTTNVKIQANMQQAMPELLMMWYGVQGFIGYQACAIIFQHWLVRKACVMPAKDAIRNGYELTINDGTQVNEEIIDAIRNYDKEYRINNNLLEFLTMGRVFGIRVAMFKIDSDDPEFYFKPFNIDGIKPGSYKGIVQIDPYWVTPQLDMEASGDPASMHFYEPTWWNVSGKLIHRTHLIIFRNGNLPDILKPTYMYGGMPVSQLIYEKVYNAERTGNELPLLTMTKRLYSLKTDIAEAIANQVEFTNRIQQAVYLRDNYGYHTIDLNEEIQQFETNLADADNVTMTLYQLVAAAANVPITKLLGTTPKGFNATGEYDEASYHEELKSIQVHDLTPFIERHHLLLINSEIAPRFGISPFSTTIEWKPLDEMTAKELADINKIKADTDIELIQGGAISPEETRQRLIQDPQSGYSGLSNEQINSEEQE
jgi:uncharacterized protein